MNTSKVFKTLQCYKKVKLDKVSTSKYFWASSSNTLWWFRLFLSVCLSSLSLRYSSLLPPAVSTTDLQRFRTVHSDNQRLRSHLVQSRVVGAV